MEACPVPEIGEELSPFIKTRQEVADVRGNLQAYLERNLRLENEHLTPNNLAAPSIPPVHPDAPSGLTGVRQAYWNALRAHQEAKSKYASLKAEVEELTKSGSTSHTRDGARSIQEDTLPLLREREKQRKLNVIDRALTSITSDESAPTNVVLDNFVKARAGDLPVLPNVSPTPHGHLEEADGRMLELKKAVLTARHTLNGHKADMNGTTSYSPQAELHALQQTRNMLINWIEKQLLVIGDAQAANEKPVESLSVEGEDAPIPVSKDEIGQIYEQYVAARKRLLQTLQHPSQHDFKAEKSNDKLLPTLKTNDKSGSTAAAMLPYMQPILDLQSSEQALSQQSTFSKTQLASAEAETDRLIHRLADESHLVVPGASHGKVEGRRTLCRIGSPDVADSRSIAEDIWRTARGGVAESLA